MTSKRPPSKSRYHKPRPNGPLYVVPLEWEHCRQLALAITSEDAFECAAMGATPLQSLAGACMTGHAYAVLRRRSGTCVGAFGCNPLHSTIWSLWGSLGLAEKAHVLTETPAWVTQLVKTAGNHRPLSNMVSSTNERALEWLARSGAFDINEDEPIDIAGVPFYPFQTISPRRKA